jgi:hypothetical protein
MNELRPDSWWIFSDRPCQYKGRYHNCATTDSFQISSPVAPPPMLYSLRDNDIDIKIYHKKSLRYSLKLSRQFWSLFNGNPLQVVLLFQTLSRAPSKGINLNSTVLKVSSSCLPSTAQEAFVVTAQLDATLTLSETNTWLPYKCLGGSWWI